MAEQYRNFMGSFWFQKEDNIYTVGLNEDAIDTFEEISTLDHKLRRFTKNVFGPIHDTPKGCKN